MIDPRILHLPPATDDGELGKRAVDLCGSNGLELDDWQEYVLIESMKRNGDRWAAREVGLHVARQNGKTSLAIARLLAGAFIVGAPMQIYSAHLYDTSMEIFRRMRQMIEDSNDLHKHLKTNKHGTVAGVQLTHGAEGFEFKNDRRIRFRTRSKGGGRGWTADMIFFDEAMILPEHVRAAMMYALSGNSLVGDPQVWYSGSAVDQQVHEYGVVFARIRERGHKGGDPDLAWFDWSIEGATPDVILPDVLRDRAAWAAANPALGKRIDPEWIEVELHGDPRSFAVERLGVGDWPRTDHVAHNPVDFEEWVSLGDDAVIVEPQVVAFDVSPERKGAIVMAGKTKTGLTQGELWMSKSGTAWVAPEVARLCKTHKVMAVCDARGPAASLVPELRDLDIAVEQLSSSEHSQACGHLLDGIQRHAISHLNDPELNAAIRAACTRPLGDAWAWSRKDSATNIAPLVAFTLGVSAAMTREKPRKVVMAWA